MQWRAGDGLGHGTEASGRPRRRTRSRRRAPSPGPLPPLYWRVRTVPGGGSRSSARTAPVAHSSRSAAGRGSSVVGGVIRRSASRASSAARRRARSDRPPSARACSRQAIRLTSQVRLLASVVSPKTSAYLLAELLGGHPLQGGDLFGRCSTLGMHAVLLGISGSRVRLTRVDSDALFERNIKLIQCRIRQTSAGQNRKRRERSGLGSVDEAEQAMARMAASSRSCSPGPSAEGSGNVGTGHLGKGVSRSDLRLTTGGCLEGLYLLITRSRERSVR